MKEKQEQNWYINIHSTKKLLLFLILLFCPCRWQFTLLLWALLLVLIFFLCTCGLFFQACLGSIHGLCTTRMLCFSLFISLCLSFSCLLYGVYLSFLFLSFLTHNHFLCTLFDICSFWRFSQIVVLFACSGLYFRVKWRRQKSDTIDPMHNVKTVYIDEEDMGKCLLPVLLLHWNFLYVFCCSERVRDELARLNNNKKLQGLLYYNFKVLNYL